MSVDAIERSNQMAENRRTDEREKEIIARHRKEMAELQKRHQQEINRIKDEYSQAMHDLHESANRNLSDREQKHIRAVQDMQEVNRKRMAAQKAEDDDKFNVTRETLEGELGRAKEKDRYDQNRLTEDFDREIERRDDEDQKMENRYRDANKKALGDQGTRLKDQAENQRKFLAGELQETRADEDREVTGLRREREKEVDFLKQKMEDQRKSLSEHYRENVKRTEANYNEHLDNMREGFQNSTEADKTRFKNRADTLADQYSKKFSRLQDSTRARVDREVDSVRRENEALEDKLVTDREKEKIQTHVEKQHLQDGYENKFDELEYRRQAAAKEAHVEKTRDIEKIVKGHDRELEKQTYEFKNKLSQQKLEGDLDREQQVNQVARERDLVKIQAETQKKRIYDNYAEKTIDQGEYYDDQLTSHKQSFERSLAEQRSVWDKQKAQDLTNIQNQMAKENVAHQEKLMETISNYERQLAATKNDYEKKLRHQEELFRDQTNRQVKNMQMDRETNEAKLQARLTQTKEFYEGEMERLRKRQLDERQQYSLKKNS